MKGITTKILFVGAVLADDECVTNPVCSAAGNKFQKNFVRSVAAATGRQLDVVSYVPAAMFPRGRQLIYRGGVREIDRRTTATFFGFINLPVLKQATQFLTLLVALVRWHRRNAAAPRVVVLFNVFAPHALAVRLARAFFRGKHIALIADLPHGLYDFSGVWGALERLDVNVQTRSIRHFDGIIVLTEMVAADFAPGVPAMVLEGAVDEHSAVPVESVPVKERVLLFTGSLIEVNGIQLLLDVFSKVSGQGYRLRIFGRGPLEPLVREAAAGDHRIDFVGFRPNREILEEQASATLLLNLRPTSHPITRYTFPSKLMEYMLSGRPVLTTRLAGIPREYERHLFVADDETPEALARTIQRICEEPEERLTEIGRGAREFVMMRKSWAAQAERVAAFVENLSRTD